MLQKYYGFIDKTQEFSYHEGTGKWILTVKEKPNV